MFLQQIINGLTIGSIYALIALGYTMVYGILKIVNFAHGDIFMTGSFLGFVLIRAGLPLFVAFPLAAFFTAILGVIIEQVAYRPIRIADRLSVLISALGVSIGLQNLAQLLWGTETHPFNADISLRMYTFSHVTISGIQIFVLLFSCLLMGVLYIFVNHTKTGVAMRATAYSLNNAKLMGINTDRIISLTFAIGSALACLAGILVGIYYDAVYPAMGYSAGLKAFAAAILGGIGSIPGAMLGGFLIGTVENLGAGYISGGYRDAFAFGILILTLILRPSGILGRKQTEKI
jgi:branched-chain amino acid transport system permease protein